jgi:hypothetical protein
MDTQDKNTSPTLNQEATTQIDEALNDIRKAINTAENAQEEILELTEVIEDSNENTAPPSEKAGTSPKSNTSIEEKAEDILAKIDSSMAANKVKNSQNQTDGATPSAAIQASNSGKTSPLDTLAQNKSYIAEEVAQKSQELFRSFIKATSKNNPEEMHFRSGTTVEDLVVELLKPELSAWLNKNLSKIVQSVVEKEIKKLIPQDE